MSGHDSPFCRRAAAGGRRVRREPGGVAGRLELAMVKATTALCDRYHVIRPDLVEQPKTVGDIRKAIEGLPDEAQAFINVEGHGEDYAIAEVWASVQVPDGEPWPTEKRTVGLEIHLGLFRESPESEPESAEVAS